MIIGADSILLCFVFDAQAFYGQVVQILSSLPELVSAELAGFRWACPKETTATCGRGKPLPEAARAHAPTPHTDTPDAAEEYEYADYAHY